MKRFALLVAVSFCFTASAHAARITNMDGSPHTITVKTSDGTQNITLAPNQSYSTGTAKGSITTENGSTLNLKGYQKSVIRDGNATLIKGQPAMRPKAAVSAPKVVH